MLSAWNDVDDLQFISEPHTLPAAKPHTCRSTRPLIALCGFLWYATSCIISLSHVVSALEAKMATSGQFYERPEESSTVTNTRHNGFPPVPTPGGTISTRPDPDKHFVVAAIDFGTTYSGYAFAFLRDSDSVHMMRKWEGGDPGVTNMKVQHINSLKSILSSTVSCDWNVHYY